MSVMGSLMEELEDTKLALAVHKAEVARLRDFLLDCMGYRTCAWCHVKVDRTVEHKGDWISEPNAHAKGCELVAVLATTSDSHTPAGKVEP